MYVSLGKVEGGGGWGGPHVVYAGVEFFGS